MVSKGPLASEVKEISSSLAGPKSRRGCVVARLCKIRWQAMMKMRTAKRTTVRAFALKDHVGEGGASYSFLLIGSWISDGRRRWKETFGTLARAVETRSRRDGFGGGAKNAMQKSVSPDGEEGVTIMAGNRDFSSTRGRDRSNNEV